MASRGMTTSYQRSAALAAVLVHADVRHGAADHERVDAPEPQQMVQRRAVEGVVADLADDSLILRRSERIDDVPAPAALASVLGPDLPLRIAVAVRVLAVDDAHPKRAGELEQPVDGRDRRFCVWHQQTAALRDEVVLHVDDDQRGPR